MSYSETQAALKASPSAWLVTGAAGFIGSNLVQKLLELDQPVTGFDNFSTGHKKNLAEVQAAVTPEQWSRFDFIEGDIADFNTCRAACAGKERVLHQAALGSVPASITDPLGCHRSNVTGFLNLLTAARDAGARSFVYASSSAVYGDDPDLPKREERIGSPISPYAASKAINETYAGVFARVYGFNSVGLRYFNVFGPRQDPNGAYAAVIPKWIAALLHNEPVCINGDGETTRDFCYIDNVVQANLLAATTQNPAAQNQVYNVALGQRITLNTLFERLQSTLHSKQSGLPAQRPVYRDFRAGDIRHSLADISRAKQLLGFEPTHSVEHGLELAMDWYRHNLR